LQKSKIDKEKYDQKLAIENIIKNQKLSNNNNKNKFKEDLSK